MEVLDALFSRRSIRQYTGEKVTDQQVETLLRAAMQAPSAVNKQPWHFVVFRDREMMHRVTEINPNAAMLKQADVAILICWDEHRQHDAGYGPVDCAAATENLLLAAHGTGLGAVWTGIYPRQNRIEGIHKLFDLPPHIKPFAIIAVGHPAEQKPGVDRFDKAKIHFETW